MYVIRSPISLADNPDVLPWLLPPHAGLNRSASVLPHPLCMNGPVVAVGAVSAQLPMPTSDGTWNARPVPTSTVELLVKRAPAWHEAQAARFASLNSTRPRSTAAGSVGAARGTRGCASIQVSSVSI